MSRGRALLLAVLIYVAADLSLPMMPGAFEFEPANCIESTQIQRGRSPADVAVVPAPALEAFVLWRPRTDARDRMAAPRHVEHLAHPAINWLRPPHGDAARPPSEDPH